MFTRRELFKNGTALVALGAGVPSIFHHSITAGYLDGVSALAAGPTNALVIVQLAGGNDGLNTVVPYADPQYKKLRANIGIPADQVIPLDNQIGLHPKLAPLKAFWDAKQLAIVQGVGYPNPNFSHFSSMHIWQTASPDGTQKGGWMGKYLDQLEQQRHDPFQGLNVGTSIAPEMTTGSTAIPSVANVASYRLVFNDAVKPNSAAGQQDLASVYKSYAPSAPYAALLETTLNDALNTSNQLRQVASSYKPAVSYSKDAFGTGLQLLAEVITSQPGFRVGHITLGGFDNHSRENPSHDRLMDSLATGLAAFCQDLEAHGKADGVVAMTWSEFGRRAGENASQGTDHGTAAPMFILGKGVKGGAYGEAPSLTNLDNGNLKFSTDFRSVYATVFEHWLQTPSASLLGGQFPLLGFV
jgi:uncharacterized protein (DUF1501 family)